MSTFRKILFAQRPIILGGTTFPDFEAVTGVSSFGSVRQDVDGEIGASFNVGSNPVIITSIGRWVLAGNSHTHLINVRDLNCSSLSSATVDCNGATVGQFVYSPMPSYFYIFAGQAFKILSTESSAAGFDTWYNESTVSVTSDFSATRGAYFITACNDSSLDGNFGLVGFKYRLADFNQVCTPSYSNTGGSGNRATPIMISVSAAGCAPAMSGGGGESAWVDGDTVSAGHGFFTGGTVDSGSWLKFDFGANNLVLITEAKFYQSDVDTQGIWQWQASNDNSTWTNIGSSFTLGGVSGGQVLNSLAGNTAKYRYYRILGVSGTSSSGSWSNEMEFKICL